MLLNNPQKNWSLKHILAVNNNVSYPLIRRTSTLLRGDPALLRSAQLKASSSLCLSLCQSAIIKHETVSQKKKRANSGASEGPVSPRRKKAGQDENNETLSSANHSRGTILKGTFDGGGARNLTSLLFNRYQSNNVPNGPTTCWDH